MGVKRAWSLRNWFSLAQPVMVPKWVRGAPEYAHIETRPGNNISVPIVALGGSISTPSIGISANVVEVKSFMELRDIGRDSVSGKIVFLIVQWM